MIFPNISFMKQYFHNMVIGLREIKNTQSNKFEKYNYRLNLLDVHFST